LTPELRGLRVGVIRHFWEEDLRIDEEAAQAMNSALDVLSQLGAEIEDARMGPMRDYDDVKVVIGETEIFAVHSPALTARLNDFGDEFLRKTLCGCLFTAADYMNAQRERRRLIDEMSALYERYDALVTASGNPPRLAGAYSVRNAWKVPSIHTPFSVTGGPALAVCTGFTANGLPLSMQIAGRPYGDATVLRVGHAYEKATRWWLRQPPLGSTAAEARVPSNGAEAPAAQPESEVLDAVRHCVGRAGLKLEQHQFQNLCECAPYAFAMAERLRRSHPRELEPASTPRFAE
jgi:aspartyl-tRNA(Asn)/glutamyl-tRNA(Gln) amidotransferase subunit A